jgi:outer membrane lipoprotein-sorting protein
MRQTHRQVPVAAAILFASLLSSCGVGTLFTKTRTIVRHGNPKLATETLLVATRVQLSERIARMYASINSFQSTVDLTPSSGSVYQGKITEIKDIRAFVLFRKPAEIRIQGQTPVIRTQAFDMVSNGTSFEFLLNSKNLFIQGANNAPAISKNKIENLRPDTFFSSMLIRPADEATETPVLMDQTDEDNALYLLLFLRKEQGGLVAKSPSRSIWFDRLDLSIVRQMVYDEDGAIVSDTRYSKWQQYSGVLFPAHIDINRPKDAYGVVMDVVDMKMNKAMTDDQFVLKKPEGAQVQILGAVKESQ